MAEVISGTRQIPLVCDLLPLPGVSARHVFREYRQVLLRDPCAYCGAEADVIDHIRSRCDGGNNAWGNLTAACNHCNSSKGYRSLLAHLGMRRWREIWQAVERRVRDNRMSWNALGRGVPA